MGFSAMASKKNRNQTYNVAIPKLFEIILELSEEKQFILLQKAEELLKREGRGHLRKSCRFSVTFATGDRIHSGYINNISQRGVFIASQAPIYIGEEIFMTFKMDGFDRTLKILGQVVHAMRWGFGVQFKSQNPNLAKLIEKLINYLPG
jgi:Tfp pilus assembly protein PilZ